MFGSAGVVVSKTTKTAANGKAFVIWRISDIAGATPATVPFSCVYACVSPYPGGRAGQPTHACSRIANTPATPATAHAARHYMARHGTARQTARRAARRGAAQRGTARHGTRHGTAHRLCASCLTVRKCNTGNWTLVPSSHCSTPRCQHYTVHIRVYRHAPRHEYRQVHRHAVSTQRG